MNAVVKQRPRSAKEQQDGWTTFLRVLARNSKLKFRIGKGFGPSTDGKVITLPALPANLTDDDLTMFKRFGHHEVGHCLHSNIPYFQKFGKDKGQKAQFMLNAIDDVYMEEAQARFSKPAERYFREGIALMTSKKIFRDGSASPFEAICCYVRFSLGARKWPEFHEGLITVKENFNKHFGEHADQLRANLDEILFREFPNVRSTEDGGLLTLRIIEMLKQQSQQQEDKPDQDDEQDDNQDDSQDESGDESDDKSDSDAQSNDAQSNDAQSDADDESGDEEGSGEGEGEGSDSSDNDNGSEAKGDDETDANSQAGNGSGAGESDGSSGSEDGSDGSGQPSLEEIIEQMFADDEIEAGEVFDDRKFIEALAGEIENGENPDYEGQSPVPAFEIDGEPVASQSTRGAGHGAIVEGMLVCPADNDIARDIASKMDRKFQVLAMRLQSLLMSQEEADVFTTRRGRIGDSHLYRFGLGDTRFFEQTEEVERVSAAVSIVADLSGSTMFVDKASGLSAFNSIQQSLLIMEKMLDQLGNPREIIGFAPSTGQLSTVVRTFGDNHLSAVARIGGLSHVVGGGHTPIGEAVFQATNRILAHEAQRKVMFVMTDGDPSNEALALEQTEAAMKAGVTVVYLLIGAEVRKDWLEAAGIPFAHAHTADELCPVLLEQAQALLM